MDSVRGMARQQQRHRRRESIRKHASCVSMPHESERGKACVNGATGSECSTIKRVQPSSTGALKCRWNANPCQLFRHSSLFSKPSWWMRCPVTPSCRATPSGMFVASHYWNAKHRRTYRNCSPLTWWIAFDQREQKLRDHFLSQPLPFILILLPKGEIDINSGSPLKRWTT